MCFFFGFAPVFQTPRWQICFKLRSYNEPKRSKSPPYGSSSLTGKRMGSEDFWKSEKMSHWDEMGVERFLLFSFCFQKGILFLWKLVVPHSELLRKHERNRSQKIRVIIRVILFHQDGKKVIFGGNLDSPPQNQTSQEKGGRNHKVYPFSLWETPTETQRKPHGVRHQKTTWVFPKIGVPQNVWFIMENPVKMDD